jgi:hypothetical protein
LVITKFRRAKMDKIIGWGLVAMAFLSAYLVIVPEHLYVG